MRARTLRLQLTLLYAVPFLVSGALLLSVPIVGASNTAPANDPGSNSRPSPGPEVSDQVTSSVVSLAIMVVVSLVLGWYIAGRFLRPLRAITGTARDISASNLHRRLGPTGRKDEFNELAKTLDDLFARLEASFESQRHFVANASHELRTPLTAERTLLQVALADPDATVDSLRSACREVLALGATQERLIDSLLTLSTSEQGVERRVPFDLATVARDVLEVRLPSADRRRITVDTSLAPAPVTGDPHLVESLVANLVDNALRHNEAGGCVWLSTSDSSIQVRNTGPAVPPAEVERLFQPFQRLSGRVGDGHGLGLAIVRAIANAHGASIRAEAVPSGGLDVSVTFP